MYMNLYNQINTLTYKHIHTHAFSVRMYPRTPYPEPLFSAEPSNLRVKPLPVHLPGLDKQST